MWRELIVRLRPATVLRAPVSPEALTAIDSTADVLVPKDIVALLQESDGAESEWGRRGPLVGP